MSGMGEVWTREQCKKIYKNEVVAGDKASKDSFWTRMYAWHNLQYKKAAGPDGNAPAELKWADDNITLMAEVEKEFENASQPVKFSLFSGIKAAGE